MAVFLVIKWVLSKKLTIKLILTCMWKAKRWTRIWMMTLTAKLATPTIPTKMAAKVVETHGKTKMISYQRMNNNCIEG